MLKSLTLVLKQQSTVPVGGPGRHPLVRAHRHQSEIGVPDGRTPIFPPPRRPSEAANNPLVEIIPGKGSGALKKHVLRFLQQKEIKALYHRVEKDSDNFGRVFVHFRWK